MTNGSKYKNAYYFLKYKKYLTFKRQKTESSLKK